MARPIKERVDWFLSNNPPRTGLCLQHTHSAILLPAAGIPDANAAVRYVRGAGKLYQGNPPKGAMVLWTSSTYGHAALSLGKHTVYGWRIASTDVKGPATVGKVALNYPVTNWGHVYAGWTDWWGGETYPVGKDDEDMALTDKDIQKIADQVWKHQLEMPENSSKPTRAAGWLLTRVWDNVKGGK